MGRRLRPRAERDRRRAALRDGAATACRCSKASTSSRSRCRSRDDVAPAARRAARDAPLGQAGGFGRARLAYRDVASATNRLTLIAAVVPAGCATVHTLFCLKTPLAVRDQAFLCGMLNSLVANYLVRLRVTTHVTAGIVSRLPVPRPPADSPRVPPDRLAGAAAWAALRTRSAMPRTPYSRPRPPALYGLDGRQLDHVLAGFPLVRQRYEGAGASRVAWWRRGRRWR